MFVESTNNKSFQTRGDMKNEQAKNWTNPILARSRWFTY
jgi:hypothetical protein